METCKYNLTELPEGVVALTEANRPDKTVLKWSGALPIPAIGTQVKVTMNKLGPGVVESYFFEHGYLGVCVKLSEQPEWHKKQSVGTRWPHSALVFGQEIAIILAPMDLQTARKVRELFGPCSSLYECHTEQELIDDYADLAAEHGDSPTVFGYWLSIQLSIEDAFGIHSDIIRDIRNRLRPYWKVVRELPESHRKEHANVA